jgi:beta-lactamase class A
MRHFLLAALILPAFAQQQHQSLDLRSAIAAIAADAKGTVSVACSLPGTASLNCDLNAAFHAPMQSVFKLPLVVTSLHLVEQGKFRLDQSVRFLPSDRILPRTVSDLQDNYPEANVDIPLGKLLEAIIRTSDNAAADTVLRVIGGPAVVTNYFHKTLGIAGFQLQDNEATLHRDHTAQYRNWFEPRAAVQFLERLPKLLNGPHTAMLMEWLRETARGNKRIRGLLPETVKVMHRPGTSGVTDGLAHATNDIGLIPLPDGRLLSLAIFVTDARANEQTRELVMARIAKIVYEAVTVSQRGGKTMFGMIGKMNSTPGKRDELIALLMEGINDMPGCLSYVVAKDPADENGIWITEVWDTKESHAASLQLPQVKKTIAAARPIIAGFSNSVTTVPVGGFGLPKN